MKAKIFLVTLLLCASQISRSQLNKDLLNYGTYNSEIGVYNDNLYFALEISRETGYSRLLAKYDGKNVSFIDNPDKGNGITLNNGYAVFKSKMLFQYTDTYEKPNSKLAVFDGNKISLITLPSDIKDINFNNYYIGNDKIYFAGISGEFQSQLLTFDGEHLGRVEIDNLPNLQMVTADCFTYKSKTYFNFFDKTSKPKYAVLSDNKLIYKDYFPTGSVSPILYKGEMYFAKDGDNSWYENIRDKSSKSGAKYTKVAIEKHKFKFPSLAKFDGEKTTVIKNLNDSSGLSIHQNRFEFNKSNGVLNFSYNIGENKEVFAKYDGERISIIEDKIPNKGIAYDSEYKSGYQKFSLDSSIHIKERLSFESDGNIINVVDSSDNGISNSIYPLINYKNKKYFIYSSHVGVGFQNLAYLENGKIHFIHNPTEDRYMNAGNLVEYKGNLVFVYDGFHLAKFDGEEISLIDDGRQL